jgi:hypothetical protein
VNSDIFFPHRSKWITTAHINMDESKGSVFKDRVLLPQVLFKTVFNTENTCYRQQRLEDLRVGKEQLLCCGVWLLAPTEAMSNTRA